MEISDLTNSSKVKQIPYEVSVVTEALTGGDGMKSRLQHLRAQLEIARSKQLQIVQIQTGVKIVGLIVCAACAFIAKLNGNEYFIYAGFIYLLLSIIFGAFNINPAVAHEIEVIETELILASTGADASQERAERLFKAHELELRRYYRLALQHSNLIFFVGIACLALGFGVVGVALALVAGYSGLVTPTEKILVASLGGVAGVLTNFVAVVYLKMFIGTTRALSQFHTRLVRTNRTHFANLLVAKISDPVLRDQTLAGMALRADAEEVKEK